MFDFIKRDAEAKAISARLAPEHWETECLKRDDGWHCNCWYDGEKCCACGDHAYDVEEAGEER